VKRLPTGQYITPSWDEGDRLILSFEGDKSNDLLPVQKLEGFAIAGADGRYHWANASIEDNKVVVWSDSVPEPVRRSVRLGATTPEKANLKNRQGLPASPFGGDATGTGADTVKNN